MFPVTMLGEPLRLGCWKFMFLKQFAYVEFIRFVERDNFRAIGSR